MLAIVDGAHENTNGLERAISSFRKSTPVRRAPSEDDTVEESFKGALGLNLLRDVAEPVIEFIFVHGLAGGSRKTWSKTPNKYHYWPKRWLSQDPEFGYVRVWSFGYKADWNERTENVLEVRDFALALLGEIENAPDIRRSKTKIVFVAHSLGGLVVKQAYILAQEDPALTSLVRRIHTLYFLATPHRGSDLAKTLMNILKISYGQKAFVSDLKLNSSLINSINDSFRHHAENLQLWSFYETSPCRISLTSAIIVNKSSATLGYAREHISPLNTDHRGICKFDSPSDPNYRTLRNAFITTIDTILLQISQIASETTSLQHGKLAELTGLSEPPINDLAALRDVCVPESCEWLTSKPTYSSWRAQRSESPPIFWLLGNAGSGKSVLCSQVVSRMQMENLKCSYFFFEHGNDVKSTIAGCLKALAYQMAKSDEAILRKVLEMAQDAVPGTEWDERTTWRELFIGCIFRLSKSSPQYWVVDALDECQKFSAFLKLIKEVPSYMRVFVTSRSTPEAQQGLISLGSLVEPYQIQVEDTLDDLGTFIDSKMSHLPISDGDRQVKLRDKLLNKSSGSFLWLSLIIQELEQTYSEEDAEEVLNEVPEDMDRMYIRVLKSLPSSERAVRLTQCLFSWTLLARRALTLSEMQCAIKLDLNRTIHDLRKPLTAICGQFMSIDRTNRIRSIHQTAYVFLLKQDAVPQLAVNEQESHNRIAQACLKFLNGDKLQGTDLRRPKSGPSFDPELLDYACTSFSDHIQKGIPEDATTYRLLCTFLETKVPTWIEYLASKAKTVHITRTAKNLQSYLKRRVTKVGPLSAGTNTLGFWIRDLAKVNSRFQAHFSLSPTAIHILIPALCPLESMMSKHYSPRHRGFLVEGLREKNWDDCFAIIDLQDKQTCNVAFGDRYLAVAESHGLIYLYYQDSIQVRHTLAFSERAKTLLLSNPCGYLAAGGLRKVAVWDTDSGIQLWVFSLAHAALSTVFDTETNALIAATQGGYVSTWDLREGRETERWEWDESVDSSRGLPKPNRSPGKTLLSPDANTLAACYRGFPIYLFDVKAKMCIGCCQRTVGSVSKTRGNQYLVDALAFNPNIEIDVLVASYGDGELAVFNKTSNDLRDCISDVFAQALACSPDGSMLVTGSSRGSIRIFKFEGIGKDTLSQIYRINAHEEGIRSIAFSGDGLHFADICGSHCHTWEPAILVQYDVDEGSQGKFSQESTFVSESRDAEGGSQAAGISVMCSDGTGDYAFCGKRDGIVALFETQGAGPRGVLYRHTLNTRITNIAYHERKNLLMTSDEAGRIFIYRLSLWKDVGEVASVVSKISTEEAIQKLLPDPSGDRLLVVGRKFTTLRTLQGEQIGGAIPLSEEHNGSIVSSHPTRTQNYVILGSNNFDVYSWVNGSKEDPLVCDNLDALNLTINPPTPPTPSLQENSQTASTTAATVPLRPTSFIAHLFATRFGENFLRVWPAESLSGQTSSSTPEPHPDPDHLGSRIRQIIAVWETRLLFLDTNLWVCSLEISSHELRAKAVKRHFFLLAEWQSDVAGVKCFIMGFSEAKREVLIVFKDRLLVVKNGLDSSEPWRM